jgi:hypothetical protein
MRSPSPGISDLSDLTARAQQKHCASASAAIPTEQAGERRRHLRRLLVFRSRIVAAHVAE